MSIKLQLNTFFSQLSNVIALNIFNFNEATLTPITLYNKNGMTFGTLPSVFLLSLSDTYKAKLSQPMSDANDNKFILTCPELLNDFYNNYMHYLHHNDVKPIPLDHISELFSDLDYMCVNLKIASYLYDSFNNEPIDELFDLFPENLPHQIANERLNRIVAKVNLDTSITQYISSEQSGVNFYTSVIKHPLFLYNPLESVLVNDFYNLAIDNNLADSIVNEYASSFYWDCVNDVTKKTFSDKYQIPLIYPTGSRSHVLTNNSSKNFRTDFDYYFSNDTTTFIIKYDSSYEHELNPCLTIVSINSKSNSKSGSKFNIWLSIDVNGKNVINDACALNNNGIYNLPLNSRPYTIKINFITLIKIEK